MSWKHFFTSIVTQMFNLKANSFTLIATYHHGPTVLWSSLVRNCRPLLTVHLISVYNFAIPVFMIHLFAVIMQVTTDDWMVSPEVGDKTLCLSLRPSYCTFLVHLNQHVV